MRALGMWLVGVALTAAVCGAAPQEPKSGEKKLTPEQQEKLKEAARHSKESTDLEKAGKFKEAIAAAEKMLALEREVFGNTHENVAYPLHRIGRMQMRLENWGASRVSYQERLQVRTALYGNDDWRVTDARLALAEVDLLARLSPADRKALDRVEKLSESADDLTEQGRFAEALSKLREASELCAKLRGEDHARYADLLLDQGWIYYQARAFSKAEPFLRQTVKIRGAVFGEKHPKYAHALNPLAILCRNTGRLDEARALYERAGTITRETIGTDNTSYIQIRSNVANLYSDLELFAEAERAAAEAVELGRKLKPTARPDDLAVWLNNLAMVYRNLKKYDKAEPLFLEAVELNKKGVQATHPDYAHNVHNLAANYFDKGAPEKAAPLFREAVAVILAHMESSAAIQSEADQLSAAIRLRFYLNSMLFASAKDDPAAVYELIYRARGAVTLRQLLGRAAASTDPEIRVLLERLRDTSRRMAALVSPSATDPAAATQFKKLAAEREKIEGQLAEKSSAFRTTQLQKFGKLADLQAALPAGVVLVDFAQHHDKLTAFVVSRAAVTRVAIGDVEPIAKAVRGMREDIEGGKASAHLGKSAAAIRASVWAPIAACAKSASHVLICPEGPLCQLPFAVLPGADPKKCLIEEIALSVVPVPQLLPEMLKRPGAANAEPASLLAVGGVKFDAIPGGDLGARDEFGTRTRAGGALKWVALPGTKNEVDALTALVAELAPKGSRTALVGEEATETAVRRHLPNHAYAHFATHGFFLPEAEAPKPLVPLRRLGDVFRDPMAEREKNPGLATGIVLAGANNPNGENDGVLTALEVGALDLGRVELVVLSACETGLGSTAGGEGVLGLQRAFQVAGARTTVTTLWQIPDHATQVLMTRFYENLWQKKMSKLDALRDAQLWMLREGKSNPEMARGLRKVGAPQPADDGRLPAYYWAAFVLSGDWR